MKSLKSIGMMTNEEARLLIKKYNAGQCSAEEKSLLDSWYMQLHVHSAGDWNEKVARISAAAEAKIEEMLDAEKKRFRVRRKKPGRSRISRLDSWLIAAAATLALSVAVFLINKNDLRHRDAKPVTISRILPGGNKASLVLADGRSIELDGAKAGIVAISDQVRYADGSGLGNKISSASPTGLQTLNVPKGGQYHLVLPDGSKVWLNAASSLVFPSSFAGAALREVKLSGEAYFEVSPDKAHPFVVSSGGQSTRVLGTHFNINNYDVGSIVTTLLEGSVKINESALLKPGEQSILVGSKVTVSPADADLAMSWKNGKTEFQDADLKSVMGMLERWYDLSVSYESYPAAARFSGSVSRSKDIVEVLRLLETTGEVHFKIEGRRVIVMK